MILQFFYILIMNRWFYIDWITAFIFGFGYWIISKKWITHHKINAKQLAAFKWLSVVLLFEWEHCIRIWWQGQERASEILMKHIAVFFYSIGDVVIIWDQHISVLFFLAGHVTFLVQCIWHDLPHAFLALSAKLLHYLILWILGIVVTVLVFKELYRKTKELQESPTQQVLYFIYIHVLSLILFVPIYHGYYGMLLFIVSDLAIGFEIPFLNGISFPLYYASLIYLHIS